MNLAGRKPWRARVLSIEGARIVVEAGGQRGPIVQTGIPADMLAAALKPGDPLEVYVHRSTKPGEAEFTTRHLDERYRAPAPPTVPAATPAGHEPALTASTCPPDGAGLPPPAATAESVPGTEAPPPPTTTPPSTPRPPAPPRTLREPSLHATVVRIEGPHDIMVHSGGCEGRLVGPVQLLEGYFRTLEPGQPLNSRVRRARTGPDGVAQFELVARARANSTVAAMSMRQAWRKVTGTWGCKPGDIVRGRIVALRGEEGAHVEIYPEVVLSLPLEQVAWEAIKPRQLSILLRDKMVLRVKVAHLDPDACAGEATLRYMPAAERAGFPLPGSGTCFLHDEVTTQRLQASEAREREQALDEMRRAKAAEEESRQRRLQRQQQAERRDELAAEPRRMHERNQRAHLLASPEAFVAGLHSAYAKTFTADDRKDYPLAEVHIGREFLDSVRALQGISIAKVMDVSVEVACGCAREVEGREVHRLRSGPAGNAPPRVRARDGATAWRCALQVKTPGARRLHWWEVPSSMGRIIELACVGHHDDMHIPE